MTSHQLQSLRQPATVTTVFGGSCAIGGYSLLGPANTSTGPAVNACSAEAAIGIATATAKQANHDLAFIPDSSGATALGRDRSDALDDSHQQQDEQDDQHQPHAARGVVAPAGAVRPCRQRSDQQYDHDDEQ